MFSRFQFALLSISPQKCPLQAPVSTCKKLRWNVRAPPISENIPDRGIDAPIIKLFPSYPICSVCTAHDIISICGGSKITKECFKVELRSPTNSNQASSLTEPVSVKQVHAFWFYLRFCFFVILRWALKLFVSLKWNPSPALKALFYDLLDFYIMLKHTHTHIDIKLLNKTSVQRLFP